MKITLHQLHVFKKVAELHSVTKAAHSLHMTQPAVSNVIRLLNDTLGTQVIEVINKRVHLTATGHILLAAGQKIERTVEEAFDQITLEQGLLAGTMRIATVSTAKYFILRLLGAFKKIYPKIHIQLAVKNRNEIIQRLHKNFDDFVIMSQLPNDSALDYHPFYEDELVVAAFPDHPLAAKKNLELKHLVDEPWLIREEGSGTRIAMLNLFKKYQLNPNIEMEIDNNESIKQAIISKMGISILSKQSIELEKNVALIKVLSIKDFPVMHEWYLVKNHGKMLSPIAHEFYNFVRSHPEVAHFKSSKIKK